MDKKEQRKVISTKMNMQRSTGSKTKSTVNALERDAEKMAMVLQLVCW